VLENAYEIGERVVDEVDRIVGDEPPVKSVAVWYLVSRAKQHEVRDGRFRKALQGVKAEQVLARYMRREIGLWLKKHMPQVWTKLSKRERQYKHVLSGSLASGKTPKTAVRIAAATVNKTRARLAKTGKGAALIGSGGSRRQWYPGKAAAKRRAGE
jgi:hypothetical protein